MKIDVNGVRIDTKEAGLDLALTTAARQDDEGIRARQQVALALGAAWKQGMLEPDLLGDIFTRVPLAPGAEAKFPLDFYSPDRESWFKAFVMPRTGGIPTQMIEGDEVAVPTYEVANQIAWSLDYAKEARWDVIERAMEVFTNGFTRKLNDDGWHVILVAAKENSISSDSSATSGAFTKKLMTTLQVDIKRLTGGRYSQVTDLYLSPEAIADLRNFSETSVDDLTLRNLLVAPEGQLPTFFGIRLHELQELGYTREYQEFLTSTIAQPISMTAGDEELCVALDLAHRDSFVMPVKEDLEVFDDENLHRERRMGVYGWMKVGFAALDTRRALLGSF